MKSAIGGGGTKEDEVRECLESILCKRFVRFRKSWSAAAAVAAVALGWGGRKDLKVSAFRLCKKTKKKKKKKKKKIAAMGDDDATVIVVSERFAGAMESLILLADTMQQAAALLFLEDEEGEEETSRTSSSSFSSSSFMSVVPLGNVVCDISQCLLKQLLLSVCLSICQRNEHNNI
jgi:hypothetical protein